MTQISLYTQDFAWQDRTKSVIKQILRPATSGPSAVLASLVRGLDELQISCELNESFLQETVGVLSGVRTLKKLMAAKKQGKIKKIIAGPNIVISPIEENNLLQDVALDAIVVPSQWVKDFYISLLPALGPKIFVWPAGVRVPTLSNTQKKFDFLVYDKLPAADTAAEIIQLLQEKKYTSKLLRYGAVGQEEYFALLEKARYVVYLSESESQGLALFEAWARNVPALVLERGMYVHGPYQFAGQVTSEYVSDQVGMHFANLEEFTKVLPQFVETKFYPCQYILNNYTDKKSAEQYLKIFNA